MQPTVTAQDFLGAMNIENREDRLQCTWNGSARRIVVDRWNELLSRARQEARIEAIEECLAEVPEQKDNGDDEFATGYYKAFNDIHTYIARLKTK